MTKTQVSIFAALCLAALLGGCGNSATTDSAVPQDAAAGQAQAAAAAQEGMAKSEANRKAQEADAAKRAAPR